MTVKKVIRKRTTKRKVGAPSIFTQKKADTICELLADGESLRKICKRPGMPGMRTVFTWLSEKSEFQQQYARARDLQADACADRVYDIACEAPERIDGGRIDPGHVQDKKLRMDAEKWRASKLAPKKYGDKSSVEIGGMDGQPIDTHWTITIVDSKGDAEDFSRS